MYAMCRFNFSDFSNEEEIDFLCGGNCCFVFVDECRKCASNQFL